MSAVSSQPQDLKIKDNLIPYLELAGWLLVSDSNERWYVFRGHSDDAGQPLEIVLPRNPHARDLPIYLNNAVNMLSALADETTERTVHRILCYDRDVLYVRNIETGEYSSLTLRVAAEQVRELRQMVVFGACSEHEPKPYFLSGQLHIAGKMVEHYRFGHTFSGSFGFTIESRIVRIPTQYTQMRLLPDGEEPPGPVMPVERRVMERIVRGLVATQKATKDRDSELLLREYASGFNSNMCQAIVNMSRARKPMEYSILWSPKIQPPDDIVGVPLVKLVDRSYEYLDFAAKQLRKLKPLYVTVRGRVTGLSSKDNPLGAGSKRSVVVRGMFPGIARATDIVIGLEKDAYVVANQAHMNWSTVTVDGVIGRTGNAWRLSDPSNFQVVS